LVDLEDSKSRRDLRSALRERVEASSQDDVLADLVAGVLGDEILDETSARNDARSEPAGADRVHVATSAPTVIGVGEF